MRAVEVDHVSKAYADKAAVRDLSFALDRGEILGLIGPNGAGKTTTIRMIMNIVMPDTGRVRILGEGWSRALRRSMGYLPEERGLYRKLTVIDCIAYLASFLGMERRETERRADELLERTGMLEHRERRIENLSKGMGQLIQFIVAVVHDPVLVILDEPFSGLDPVNAELLKGMAADLRERGKAVMLSTHNMNDVERLCDRVLMMDDGRAILTGGIPHVRSLYPAASSLNEVFLQALEASHE